jgi:hypothetical protein
LVGTLTKSLCNDAVVGAMLRATPSFLPAFQWQSTARRRVTVARSMLSCGRRAGC